MRCNCNRFIGLNKWARDFVRGEAVLVYIEQVTRNYPSGAPVAMVDKAGVEKLMSDYALHPFYGQRKTLPPRPVFDFVVDREESGEFYVGTDGERCPLYVYIFPSGKKYFEKAQRNPASPEKVCFLALQDKNGNWIPESLWPLK